MSTACRDRIIKTSWPPVNKENSNGMATFEIFYFPDPVGDKSVSRRESAYRVHFGALAENEPIQCGSAGSGSALSQIGIREFIR